MSEEGLTVVQALRKALALFERIEAGDRTKLPQGETEEELSWTRDFCRDLAADIDLLLDPSMTTKECSDALARRSADDKERHELRSVIYAKTGAPVDPRLSLEDLRELRNQLQQREDEYVRTMLARTDRKQTQH